MKRPWVFLLVVLCIAAVFRLYTLGDIPVGLHRDEAFLGYNAYSLMKTGKDMSGDMFPLHFKSFLYSPAGYSYVSIPFISLFGLSSNAVRLASSVSGILTVLGVYMLGKELFEKTLTRRYAQYASILASFLIAVLPWHVNLSRTATENTVVTCALVWGVLLFIKYGQSQRLQMLFSSFGMFFSTLLVYQAPRAFLPFFIPVLLLVYPSKKKVWQLAMVVLYAFMIVLPVFMIIRSPELSLRIRTVGVWGNGNATLIVDEQIREDGVQHVPPVVARIFHNKGIGYSSEIIKNYADHFSYRFLFTDEGKPDRYRVPHQGLLYLFMLPFVVYGAVQIVGHDRRVGMCLLAWIFLTPLGSALTFDDVPNMQRTVGMVPPIVLLTSYGIVSYVQTVRRRLKALMISTLILVCAYSVSAYVHAYMVNQIVHFPLYRQEGYRELVSSINELLPGYTKAVVTNYESAPAIFFLFYNQYDPSVFQSETRGKDVRDFDKIAFGPYEFSEEQCPLRVDPNTGHVTGESDVIYVNHATCLADEGIREIKTIQRSDGTDVFRIVEKVSE